MSGLLAKPSPAKIAEITSRTQGKAVNLLDRKREPRAFTPGEKSLIRKVHGYMPAQQLLDVLNERLVSDLGPGEPRYTMQQLYAEIGTSEAQTSAHDWSSLRKLLAKAKRDGVLELITREVIDDFAVVYSLSPAQVLQLQDVLLHAKEGDEA